MEPRQEGKIWDLHHNKDIWDPTHQRKLKVIYTSSHNKTESTYEQWDARKNDQVAYSGCKRS